MNKITPHISAAPKPLLITGSHSGKQVFCTHPQLVNVFKQLNSMALAGNYWALIAVKQIQSLGAGRLHQDNIFIRQNSLNPNTRGQFFMILPGFKATFFSHSDDKVELKNLEIDTNYEGLQKIHKKPTTFIVKQSKPKEFSIKPIEKPVNIPIRDTLVLVSDTNYKGPEEFLEVAVGLASNTDFVNKSILETDSFLLHFTPGNKGIVGLRSTKDLLNNAKKAVIMESVQQLAHIMHSAKDLPGTRWISIRGGSTITHRALEVVNDKSIKLNKHLLYLANPTSNARRTIDLCEKLGMRGGQSTAGWHPKEIIGNRIPGLARKENLINAFDGTVGLAGAASTAAGLFAATASAPAVALVGGAALGYSVIKFGLKAYKATTGR